MWTPKLLTSLFIFSSITFSESHNILVIFPHFGRSHFTVFENLFKTLAHKGHNVTVISFFQQKNSIPNYRDVTISPDGMLGKLKTLSLDQFENPRQAMYTGADLLGEISSSVCEHFLSHPNLQTFLKENNSFDLVMVELFNTNCHLGVANRFKAPIIGLSSCLPFPWYTSKFGQPDNPAYIPEVMMGFSDKMNFFERTENFLVLQYHKLVYEFRMRRPGTALSKKYIGEDPEEAWENLSMMLANMHFTATLPRPIVPGLIDIAGLHIEEAQAIPKDLDKYLNESKHGVVYICMGSVIKGSTFPKEKQQHFLNAFSKIPQRVIWKWEDDMDGLPSNVKLVKWVPQRSILCHPNLKVFITHGGLLGTLEAMHCGVPLIVIPQFVDQYSTAAAVEANGNGVTMFFKEATEERILENLKKVSTNEFRMQVKSQSERYRDRPLPPMETALYWTEYVIRHKGANFMRTAAVGMPFYQYYLLDVMAFIVFVLCILAFVIYRVLTLVFRLMFRKKPKVKQN